MAEDYKGIRIPALRKIAEEKGLEDYEDLERDDLVEMLEDYDKQPEEEEEEEEPDEEEETESSEDEDEESEEEETEEETPEEEEEEEEIEETPKQVAGITDGNVPVGSKAEKMKARLALQPEITIMIPLEGREKKGSTFPVTINGYRLNIQKGVYVPVPKQVAEIVMDSQSQTIAAADEMKRVEDGKPIKIDGSVTGDPLN